MPLSCAAVASCCLASAAATASTLALTLPVSSNFAAAASLIDATSALIALTLVWVSCCMASWAAFRDSAKLPPCAISSSKLNSPVISKAAASARVSRAALVFAAKPSIVFWVAAVANLNACNCSGVSLKSASVNCAIDFPAFAASSPSLSNSPPTVPAPTSALPASSLLSTLSSGARFFSMSISASCWLKVARPLAALT